MPVLWLTFVSADSLCTVAVIVLFTMVKFKSTIDQDRINIIRYVRINFEFAPCDALKSDFYHFRFIYFATIDFRFQFAHFPYKNAGMMSLSRPVLD